MRQGRDSKPIHQTQGSDSAKRIQLARALSCEIWLVFLVSILQFVKLAYFMCWSILEEVIYSYGHGNDHPGNRFPSYLSLHRLYK